MSLKTVAVHKNGVKIKSFICQRAEINGNSIVFSGVPSKNGGNIDISHYGETFVEVDHLNKRAFVSLPNESETIEMFISW